MDSSTLDRLHSPEHVKCLQWFEDHAGEAVRFNDLTADGVRLVTQFKGIYKPHWMPYALSVRATEQDRYADGQIIRQDDGSWRMSYAQEEDGRFDSRVLYTNRGIQACMNDGIPIGILWKENREDAYEVVGLGLPIEWAEGFFTIVSYQPDAVAESPEDPDAEADHLAAPDSRHELKMAVLELIRLLRVQHGPDDLPKRHQPLTLLWAIGRARQGQPQLVDWPTARVQIGDLIDRFGRATDAHNPHLPFLALGSSGLWQLTGTPPPKGQSGDPRLTWLNKTTPTIKGGLTIRVHNLMIDDDDAAAEAVNALLAGYFGGEEHSQLLQAVGLSSLITGHVHRAGPKARITQPGTRTGRIADAVLRAAIEKHAVDLVMTRYRQLGYTVTDVGTTESYDVLAIKDGEELHIEVKGSSGTAYDVELTVNEVDHARAGIPTDLVVVDEIKWTRHDDGTIQTSVGRYRSWHNWQPAEENLKASRYRYHLIL
jgi:hypothetical protein